jgi:hypothetical protein
LSWRLWNRETFCCEPGEANATTPAISIDRDSEAYNADMPELSGSVDSLDEEAIEFENDSATSTAAPVDIHPKIRRQDSMGSRSRGRERHITPDDLEKMVITIKEKKDLEPLELSTHTYLAPLANHTMQQSTADIESIAIPETEEEKSSQSISEAGSRESGRSTTSIVRGFSPSQISQSYRTIPLDIDPEQQQEASPAELKPPAPKHSKRQMFALGASSGEESFNEHASSIEGHMQQRQQAKKKANVFTLGGSSGEDDSSLRSNMQSSMAQRSSMASGLRRPLEPKKQTSFKEEVATRTIHEDSILDDDVFETDDEDDIDESAIDDDDDSSDWEDSLEDSNKSSIDEKTFFQRVDSRPNLTSRRSLITTMLHQKDRAAALTNAASRSVPAMQRSRTSSPNGPSLAASPESDDAAPLMMRKGLRPAEIPRSSAQPITMPATGPAHEAALSPKTTRRQMLSNELTQSLRRHLLWERQQKNQTATAVLKRRHTAHENLGNLKQYPEKVHLGTDDRDGKNGSWNQYFGQGLGEYHSKGW